MFNLTFTEVFTPLFIAFLIFHLHKKIKHFPYIAAGAIALLTGFLVFNYADSKISFENIPDGESISSVMGTFGDFFGGTLNPILSFFTFICLLITIGIQRTELELTRNELKKSAEEQAKSANAATRQACETTIFNLINLHRNILSDIECKPVKNKNEPTHYFYGEEINHTQAPQKPLTSIEVFKHALIGYSSPNCHAQPKNEKIEEIISNLNYSELNKDNAYTFEAYFKLLYQLLSIIDSYDLSLIAKTQKEAYIEIVKSYLSTPELSLLMIHCIHKHTKQLKLKALIIKYEILSEVLITKKTENNEEGIITLYTAGNYCTLPEYSLCEYIVLSNDKLTCIASAFGIKSELTKQLIEGMKSNNFYTNKTSENEDKSLYFREITADQYQKDD